MDDALEVVLTVSQPAAWLEAIAKVTYALPPCKRARERSRIVVGALRRVAVARPYRLSQVFRVQTESPQPFGAV
jgi:hypothetical protein